MGSPASSPYHVGVYGSPATPGTGLTENAVSRTVTPVVRQRRRRDEPQVRPSVATDFTNSEASARPLRHRNGLLEFHHTALYFIG